MDSGRGGTDRAIQYTADALQVVLVWLAHENNIVPAGEREPGGEVQILPRKILVNEQEIHYGFLLEQITFRWNHLNV
jgi:hypothetical protein